MMDRDQGVRLTTDAAARANDSRPAANETSHSASGGWSTRPTTLVFWPSEAIALGMNWFSALHHHYATQVIISAGAPLQVRARVNEPYTVQQSLIVAPQVQHEVEATGTPCFVLWSESRALANLAHRLRIASATELPALSQDQLSSLLPLLLASEKQTPDEGAGRSLLSHALTALIGQTWGEEPDDRRIATARSLVTPQFLSEQRQPITSLATHVHLSVGRFRHLFRSEMGISVQSYLRWRRLYAALRATAQGASLTEAAHVAGFADSAHLTRVFRATFGLPPSHILKNSHAVQVIPGAER